MKDTVLDISIWKSNRNPRPVMPQTEFLILVPHSALSSLLQKIAIPIFKLLMLKIIAAYIPMLHACVCLLNCFSHAWHFATLRTIACQAPLSMGFSRQGYWSGLPCLLPPGESSQPRDQTCVSYLSCIGRHALYHRQHMGSLIHIFHFYLIPNPLGLIPNPLSFWKTYFLKTFTYLAALGLSCSYRIF